MRIIKYILALASILPFAAYAQTQTDYEHAMFRFMKAYNRDEGDSINQMFGGPWDSTKATTPLWTNEQCISMQKEYGYIKEFKYIGIDMLDPERVAVFKVDFTKAGMKTSSFTLGSDGRFETFRFITSSAGIDKLLQRDR